MQGTNGNDGDHGTTQLARGSRAPARGTRGPRPGAGHARAVLAKGCSIDVHPRSFGPGAGAQTTLGLAGVVLLSLGSTGDEFAVLVRTSFATYLTDWLTDASLEFRS